MADTATPAKAKVLVVDDSSLVRLYYRSALETAGFEVVEEGTKPMTLYFLSRKSRS